MDSFDGDPPPLRGGEMPKERLSMRKTREILRQRWVLGRSYRDVRDQLGVMHGHGHPGILHRFLSR